MSSGYNYKTLDNVILHSDCDLEVRLSCLKVSFNIGQAGLSCTMLLSFIGELFAGDFKGAIQG